MRLLKMSIEEMVAYFEQLERQSKALREEALRLCWYMRGGITLDDAMSLSNQDRDIIASIIKENLETSKKTGMPFF
jgi:hypothetical protein